MTISLLRTLLVPCFVLLAACAQLGDTRSPDPDSGSDLISEADRLVGNYALSSFVIWKNDVAYTQDAYSTFEGGLAFDDNTRYTTFLYLDGERTSSHGSWRVLPGNILQLTDSSGCIFSAPYILAHAYSQLIYSSSRAQCNGSYPQQDVTFDRLD